jgi:hypothetical protein
MIFDKHTLTLRVQRLRHPAIHSQVPRSKTVRLVANFRLEVNAADPPLYHVRSKFGCSKTALATRGGSLAAITLTFCDTKVVA